MIGNPASSGEGTADCLLISGFAKLFLQVVHRFLKLPEQAFFGSGVNPKCNLTAYLP
jgi:hypothetical protein